VSLPSREISKEEPKLRLPLHSNRRGRCPNGFHRKAQRHPNVSPPWLKQGANQKACLDGGVCCLWVGFLEVLLGVGFGAS
jgi:hypothetical protein